MPALTFADVNPEPDDDEAEGPDNLPFVRDPRKPMGPKLRATIIKRIRRSVRAHGTFELACQAAGLPFELFEQWIAEDQHLKVTLLKDQADFKETIARRAADPEALQSQRKADLELLGRLDKSWAPRSRTTLATQFQDFLSETKRVETQEVAERIIARLAKYT